MEPPRVLRSRRGEQTHETIDGPAGTTNHKTSAGDDENNPWPRRIVNLRYGEWTHSEAPMPQQIFLRRTSKLVQPFQLAHERSVSFTGKHVAPEASKAARHLIAVTWKKTEHLQQHGQNTAEQAALLRPPKLSRHSLEAADHTSASLVPGSSLQTLGVNEGRRRDAAVVTVQGEQAPNLHGPVAGAGPRQRTLQS